MNQDISFMSELFRIVNGALRLDIDKVRNYTAFLADKLEKAGDQASAGRLRKMLEESDQQLRPTGAAFAKVLPGLVRPPMSRRAQDDPEILAYVRHKQPLAEDLIPAGEIARASVFLMSDEARMITGDTLTDRKS